MRWDSPFIHQPEEHGCHMRTEAKWEFSPSSAFVLQTLQLLTSLVKGRLRNTRKLVEMTTSLSGWSMIKRIYFYFGAFIKTMLVASARGTRDSRLLYLFITTAWYRRNTEQELKSKFRVQLFWVSSCHWNLHHVSYLSKTFSFPTYK